MSETKTTEALLAEARARKAGRAAEADKIREARELAILLLEEQLEPVHGKLGEGFAIVDGGAEGPIAVKLGEAVLYKAFHASIDKAKAKGQGDGITPEVCHVFVAPCVVHPTREEFNAIVLRRQGLVFACANALEGLYGKNEAAILEKS